MSENEKLLRIIQPRMFSNSHINFHILKDRAFNLRWASQPEDIIPLTAADPDFPCAPAIREAICRFTQEGYFSYAPPEGYLFFREALAAFYEQKRKISISPQNIMAVNSAASGIYIACKAMLKKGDEAIIFNPVDFLFKHCIELAEAIPVSLPVSSNPNEEINYELLESLITPKTKLLCLCNPLNPTGKVFSRQELTQIASIALKHNIIILSDEIWSDIVFDPFAYTSIAALNEAVSKHTIIVTGFSKSYGLAGLRIGALLTGSDILFEKLKSTSLHQSTIDGSGVLGQVAASTALLECESWLTSFIKHLTEIRDMSVDTLNKIPGVACHTPQGCYLLFCNIQKTGYQSQEMHDLLIEKARVAVVPGRSHWFGSGAEGFIRICFSTSEDILKDAYERIRLTIMNNPVNR